MPDSVKSANAQNNSKGGAKRAKRFPYFMRQMSTLPVLQEEETYQVSFTAIIRNGSKAEFTQLDYSGVHRAVHPLLALGLAIAEIDSRYSSAEVDVSSISIKKF